MINTDDPLTPPQLLALRHIPRIWRNELRVLLLLDGRLRSLVQRGNEPLLTQMKLAWWRDALKKDHNSRPKGEPLLAEISALEKAGCSTIGANAIHLVDAWEEMADPDAIDADAASRHFAGRARGIFMAFAERIGEGERLYTAGLVWAGAELPDRKIKLSRKARAFSLLARATQVEREPSFGSTLGFFWHALTGL